MVTEEKLNQYHPCANCGTNFKVEELRERGIQSDGHLGIRGIPEVYIFGFNLWKSLAVIIALGAVVGIVYFSYVSATYTDKAYRIVNFIHREEVQIIDAEGEVIDKVGFNLGSSLDLDEYSPVEEGEFNGQVNLGYNRVDVRGKNGEKFATVIKGRGRNPLHSEASGWR